MYCVCFLACGFPKPLKMTLRSFKRIIPKRIKPRSNAARPSQIPAAVEAIPMNYLKTPSFPRGREFGNQLSANSGASSVLAHAALLVGRQLEMMNVLLGYEQANKYSLKNYQGVDVGFIAEEESTFKNTILRQILKTRRSYDADVLDNQGNLVLKIHRPLKWFLNSTITISTPTGAVIGTVKSDWHLWRRRYDLFVGTSQFARIDNGLWAWDFDAHTQESVPLASINRNFSGFIKEIFTDMGQYVVHYDATLEQERPLSLDERAVVLAGAMSIDIDYFSRHSNSDGILPVGMMAGTTATTPIPTGASDVAGGASDGVAGNVLGGAMGSAIPTDFGSSNPEPFNPPSSSPEAGKNQWGDDGFLDDGPTDFGSSNPEPFNPPSSSEAGKNQWGDDGFLDDGGFSEEESSFFKNIWDFVNNDD